ncbi:unnamed protein product [Auanema sp. JU1783]|nr:unnamed protein product [Auanema sp. JU1783]
MTHPSAPMLQAEYHNYNEQSAFNDYYGGYEQRSGTWSGNGPRRMDTTAEKHPTRCRSNSNVSIYCLNIIVILRALIVLTLIALGYQAGYNMYLMYYVAGFECLSLLASVLMCCGMEYRQPFFCVLFGVFRSIEAFFCLLAVVCFGYSIWDRRSESARYISIFVNDMAHSYFPKSNIGWEDCMFQ